MYALVKNAHSGLRWLMLAGVIFVVVNAARAMSSSRAYTPQDARLSLITMVVADLQLTLGLVLYTALSPLMTQSILPNFGAAMKDRVLRFWAVEHITMMVLSIVVIHVVRVMVKKADTDAVRHKRTMYGFALALAMVWAGMPWPWKPYGRPLMGGDAPAPSASVAPSAVPSGR